MIRWTHPITGATVADAVFEPRRILASAGTGKTYTLVGRYLDLVFAGCDPATILATTFTRAAAAEIRDRVFNDLATLVLDDETRTRQNDAGRFKVGSIDSPQAIAALEEMVAALPDLQIRTLDSVFAGLAGGLGPASGIPADARLVDGDAADDLLRESIGRAMDDADEDEMLDTLETLGRGATKVAVVPTVQKAVNGLLATADESSAEAWWWSHPARDEAMLEELRRIHDAFGVVLPSLGGRVATAIRKVRDLLAAAIERDGRIWIDLLGNTLVANAGVDGTGLYYGKPIDDSVRPMLEVLHSAAVGGNLRNLAMRTACLRHLVDAISPRYRQAKRHARAAEFDDFVRALDPIRGGLGPESLDELWFRLDTRLEHLLLDEFQDTSATQLRAIRPLAEEILGGGDGERPRSLLVVGDVKQSLYGWRGGDPRILERFGTAIGTDESVIPAEPLVRSHRSSPAVIGLVNRVFAGIGENPAPLAKSPNAAAEFASLFDEHSTAKDLAGEAIVEFLPAPDPDEGEREADVIAAAAAASAASLVRRHPGGTVAVIVRSNRFIGAIVEALRDLGVDARGRGSGSLMDAEAAIAVVQAFRLAADPEDRIAAEDLARSPLGPLVGFAAPEVDVDRRVREADRRAVGVGLRRRFDIEGGAAVVDGWRRALADRLTRREAARLRQMVELLEGFDGDPGAPRSPRAIERHLRSCGVDDPGGGGVVVMTVHQSKGLEFDGVVVTETKTPFFREPDLAVATPSVPAGPIERVATWYSERARPADTELVHQQTIDRTVLESLCGLYVALTRAARDLVVQVPRPAFNDDGRPGAKSLPTWGGVVRCSIDRQRETDAAGAEPDEHDDRPVHESEIASGLPGSLVVHRIVHGTPGSDSEAAGAASAEAAIAAASQAGSPRITVRPAVGGRRRAVAARAASSSHARTDLLRRSDPDALERGSVVHALFEVVEHAADIDRLDDDTLLAVGRGVAPGRDEGWHRTQIASVRGALADPAVRAAYDGGPGPTVVRVEFPFLRRTPQGVQTGFIDRLVLRLDRDPVAGPVKDGSPPSVVGASIIDFKTDRPDPGAADDLGDFLDRHRHQMGDYRSVIAGRYDLDPSRISVSLIRVEDAQVVEVPVEMPT